MCSRRRGSPAGCGRRGGGGEHSNNVGTGTRGRRGRHAPERNPGCPEEKRRIAPTPVWADCQPPRVAATSALRVVTSKRVAVGFIAALSRTKHRPCALHWPRTVFLA